MAAKKRAKTLSSSKPTTGSLFDDAALAPTEPAPALPMAGGVMAEAEDARERPKLRMVDPLPDIPEEDVIVEPNGDGRFVVSLLRHYGTTAAAVVYTRKQLEMLQRRIGPALEVG